MPIKSCVISWITIFTILFVGQTSSVISQDLRRKHAENFSENHQKIINGLAKAIWEKPAEGLALKSISEKDHFVFHVWSIDPKLYRFSVVEQDKPTGFNVADLLQNSEAILAINAGFFEKGPEGQHLSASGLLIANGKASMAYTPRAGSGVFYVKNNMPFIDWSRNFKDESSLIGITDAVQVGPMVVDPGGRNGIMRDDDKKAHRSALCKREADVLIVATTALISLYELGHILSEPEEKGGLGCERALNLDGGPSTQVSFKEDAHSLTIPAQSKVHNAIVAVRRDAKHKKEEKETESKKAGQ